MVPSTRGAGRQQLLLRPDVTLPATLVLAQTRLEACQRVGADSLLHLPKQLTLQLSRLQSGCSPTDLPPALLSPPPLCPKVLPPVLPLPPLCPNPTLSFLPLQILSSNCLPSKLFSVEKHVVAQAYNPRYFLDLGSRVESPRPAWAIGILSS